MEGTQLIDTFHSMITHRSMFMLWKPPGNPPRIHQVIRLKEDASDNDIGEDTDTVKLENSIP